MLVSFFKDTRKRYEYTSSDAFDGLFFALAAKQPSKQNITIRVKKKKAKLFFFRLNSLIKLRRLCKARSC